MALGEGPRRQRSRVGGGGGRGAAAPDDKGIVAGGSPRPSRHRDARPPTLTLSITTGWFAITS